MIRFLFTRSATLRRPGAGDGRRAAAPPLTTWISPPCAPGCRWAADAVRAGADRLPAPRPRRQRDPRLGPGPALGGRVLLRIEDHDRQRCRPEYEAAMLDDLDWLGLRPRRVSDRGVPRRRVRRAAVGSRGGLPRRRRRPGRARAGLRLPLHAPRDWRRRAPATPANCATRAPAVGSGCRSTTGSAGGSRRPRRGDLRRRRPWPDHPAAGGAVRRPAAARSARQLDLSVRGRGRRHGAGHRSGRARRRSVRLDRPADPAGPSARSRRRPRSSPITRW